MNEYFDYVNPSMLRKNPGLRSTDTSYQASIHTGSPRNLLGKCLPPLCLLRAEGGLQCVVYGSHGSCRTSHRPLGPTHANTKGHSTKLADIIRTRNTAHPFELQT